MTENVSIDWLAERIALRVCEIPDRTSPDDQPEMCLVTPNELRAIILDEWRTMQEKRSLREEETKAQVVGMPPPYPHIVLNTETGGDAVSKHDYDTLRAQLAEAMAENRRLHEGKTIRWANAARSVCP